MTALNKQALREVAEKALPAMQRLLMMPNDELFDEALLNVDGDVDAANTFNLNFGPETALALLDELEKEKGYASTYEAEKWHYHGLAESEGERAGRAEKALEAAEKRIASLQREIEYIRNRYKELDLLIGKNILVMQAAVIEWQATGDAKNGLAWIYNTLFGPGELPDESEKDAQAYFDRKYAPIDEKLMALHKWFWEQSEAERASAGIGVKGG
ncbi:ead/Ea22-like family protein [Salmonella enterica]|nr:ead/Ea22-like family protein [Salmonella enterica subsp. enterica]EJJ8164704.1 ead/Ea22-like family protein [Salmonella enterica]